MLHKTKGIVLKTVKYGETSLVATIFTELFGVQTYMVKGARTSTKKASPKALMLQPAANLELVVYHNELKHLQYISDIKWGNIYQQIMSNVLKNCIALFLVELVQKTIKQPEANPELFYFFENHLQILDEAEVAVAANLPLHFSLHWAMALGFGIEENVSAKNLIDLKDGNFTNTIPAHGHYLEGRLAEATSEIIRLQQAVSLFRIKLNKTQRQQLLKAYEQFFQYHISDFGALKSLDVLSAIF